MARYRKKPVVIEAVRWDGIGNTFEKVNDWWADTYTEGDDLYITTLEGTMKADVGDYVIKGVQGEVYPCKPSIFEATYEPVPD